SLQDRVLKKGSFFFLLSLYCDTVSSKSIGSVVVSTGEVMLCRDQHSFPLVDFLVFKSPPPGFHSRWPLVGRAPTALCLCVISMLLCLQSPASCTTCPQKCRCEDQQFYCDTQGLEAPPDGVDRGALGLSLRHNSIEDAFQGLYKLKDLNLSSNRITTLPNTTFIHLINLQILDLSFNLMTALEPELFHGLRKLQILHLRSNSLRTTPVRAFWDCRSLEYLGLSNNRLRSLARNGFAGLFLYLQWNKISNLTCNMEWTWTTLEKLDLTGNEIRVLTPDVFETLPNLKILLLDNNNFRYTVVYSISLSRGYQWWKGTWIMIRFLLKRHTVATVCYYHNHLLVQK
uniref:Leucine rich repeat transmembrane neuronal 2 n=1 Tax=Hucho hucho TaxID=62062 RepID=A0A4W5KY02_9TELE